MLPLHKTSVYQSYSRLASQNRVSRWRDYPVDIWVFSSTLTIQRGQDLHVGFPQQRQSIVVDVQVGQMGNEVVANQEAHQDPVIDDVLQAVLKW